MSLRQQALDLARRQIDEGLAEWSRATNKHERKDARVKIMDAMERYDRTADAKFGAFRDEERGL